MVFLQGSTRVGAYQAPGTPSPSVAGATTPFTTYQAPEGALGGGASVVSLTSAPTSEYDSPQGEASGHAYVQLTGTGQSVQWTNNTGSRSTSSTCAPRSPTPPAGGGMTATLDLYVNGVFRQAICHELDPELGVRGQQQLQRQRPEPRRRRPARLLGRVPRLRQRRGDSRRGDLQPAEGLGEHASFYWINSIDLWNAPAPAAQPANSISITSCGAVADNTPTNGTAAPGATDSTADIQNCINQAASSRARSCGSRRAPST
jgi:hypothetical protein